MEKVRKQRFWFDVSNLLLSFLPNDRKNVVREERRGLICAVALVVAYVPKIGM